MAKQVGLFGLRGKIENKSFYKTAGVEDTVIRQIPEGLSSRVKTAAEYANTRLNNSEFKNANWMASFLFNAIPNRRASMTRRFAIAEMTKGGLEYIKAGTGSWGLRIPRAGFGAIAKDLLDDRAKSGPYNNEFGVLDWSTDQSGEYEITLEADQATVNELVSRGIDGIFAVTIRGAGAEEVVDDEIRQHYGHSAPSPRQVGFSIGDTISESFTFTPSPTALGMSQAGYTAAVGAANNGMFFIIAFIPFRTIGSSMGSNIYSLYEYATYAVLDLGAIPT